VRRGAGPAGPLGAVEELGAPGRHRVARGAGGKAPGREPRAQQGADDRARRRPDDHLGLAGIPARGGGQPVENPGVVGVPDDTAGAEDQADAVWGRHGSIVGLASVAEGRYPAERIGNISNILNNFPMRLRRLAVLLFSAVLAVAAVVACAPVKPGAPGSVSVIGTSDLTSDQLAWFFWANQPPGSPCLTVSVEQLAADFVWDGNVENVRGDIGFAQSIIETGWFRYGGQVQCGQNNFGGLGAVDGGAGGASFPDADTGVRAQIQHLRAYADATATSCTQPPL